MQPTEWDEVYMRKPSNTDTMYPDPWGHLDTIEDEKMFKAVTVFARIVSAFFGVGLIMLLYTAWEWLHP